MNTAIKVTRGLVGITGLLQLALGIVFWTGHLRNLIAFHMINGLVFVLALWTLAGLTARASAPIPLVVTTFVWGIILPAFGMMQMNLLPGPWHWVIKVTHLLTGLVAMRLGDQLFQRVRSNADFGGFVARRGVPPSFLPSQVTVSTPGCITPFRSSGERRRGVDVRFGGIAEAPAA